MVRFSFFLCDLVGIQVPRSAIYTLLESSLCPRPLLDSTRCKPHSDIAEYDRGLAQLASGLGIERLTSFAVPAHFFEYQPCSLLSSSNDSRRGLLLLQNFSLAARRELPGIIEKVKYMRVFTQKTVTKPVIL